MYTKLQNIHSFDTHRTEFVTTHRETSSLTRWRKLQWAETKSREDGEYSTWIWKRMPLELEFYGEHNSKNRKGSCRDVT